MCQNGRPKLLQHKNYFDPASEPFENLRDSHAPLVWQCRYSGIEVPDQLWTFSATGEGKKYSENQAEDMISETGFMADFEKWVKEFEQLVDAKGKVPPNKYRAFGHKAPQHLWANVQDGLRYFRMMVREFKFWLRSPVSGRSNTRTSEIPFQHLVT